jgi:chemotaxis protein MotB
LKVGIRRGRMVLELPNDILFDSGKTEVKPAGKSALADVAKVLRGLPGRTFQVAGHTDNVKIQSARYPSNWELSTARAVEVTKLLVDGGMDPKMLSAAGYGEWDPAADNASPDGRAKNRRIEITLVPNMEELVKLPDGVEDPPPTKGKPAAAAPKPSAKAAAH